MSIYTTALANTTAAPRGPAQTEAILFAHDGTVQHCDTAIMRVHAVNIGGTAHAHNMTTCQEIFGRCSAAYKIAVQLPSLGTDRTAI
jgi:hypothetical protein